MLLLATGAANADVTVKGDTIFRNCFIDPYQGKMAALFAKDKALPRWPSSTQKIMTTPTV